MNCRLWTAKDVEVVRREYGCRPARVLAEKLGRTARSVYQLANRLGLVEHHPVIDLEAIRQLSQQGLCDSDVAQKLNLDRHTVSKHRRAMGLPSQARGLNYREKVRARTRKQCHEAGVESLGQMRALVERVRIARSRWPMVGTEREVQVLNALAVHGPLTRRQLAAEIGLPWRGIRRTMKGCVPGGTYLASLIRQGLVAVVGRRYGAGCSYETLYALAPGVHARGA